MKKVSLSIIIASLLFFSMSISKVNYVYAINTINEYDDEVNDYIKQLQSIQNQIYVLSSNCLKDFIDKSNNNQLLKDSAFIKSQIKDFRIQLSDYHKKKSGDTGKNPLSLGLLNTLNYYSMALSYLICFLEHSEVSEKNNCLQSYYFSKSFGDQTLNWIKSEFKIYK